MNFEEKLQDFAALVAVAMNAAPEQFPAWSDGSAAHMAALGELWSEIRPHLNLDAEMARRLEDKLRQLFAAFRDGQADNGMSIARSLYADLASLL